MNRIRSNANKYKNMSVPAKAAIWYSFCNILQKGISFIVVPIYVRLLTIAEYGQYTVFQSWRDVLIIVATLNLYCGVFTKAMVDYKDDRDRYTSCMQGLSTVVTLALLVIYLVVSNFWSSLLEIDFITIILLFVYYVFYPAFLFWSVRQRVEYKYKSMIIATLMTSILTPVLSIILLKVTSLGENAVIWGFLFVQIVVGAIFYFYNFVRGKCFYNKDYWEHALKFNIPLIPHYLSLIVLGQADRIMIKDICGADKAGIYSLAYSVSLLMNVFIAAINGSLVPWIYEKLKHKDYKPISMVSRNLCILVGIMTLGAILISPEIIHILGTEEYMEAIWVVPVVSLSVYYIFCYGLFSNIEFYFNATGYVMIASTVGAALNIVLNALFIPIYGFIAAAYTTLVCYILFMVMHYLFMRKICKTQIEGEVVYDNKFIAVSSIILFALMFACLLIYRITAVRYCIIALLVVIAIIYRRKIGALMKGLK